MKKAAFICLCLLFLVPKLTFADSATVLEEFDAYLDKTAAQLGDSPFAAVVSKNGDIIFERYHDGYGALGRPVGQDSRWQIFSITKSFVSALVLNLCETGALTLDDRVGQYLPSFTQHGEGPFDRRDVTIRHLLSHTSGAAFEGSKVPNPLPPGLDRIDIITPPGQDFKYSGLGMMILERALEAATGEDVDTLLDERVIRPLGLGSTGYVYPGSATDRVLPLKKGFYHYAQDGKRAGAGLYTTARDLNRFGQFWLDPSSLFSPELRQQAWTHHGTRESDQGRYGLMWWLFEADGGFVMSGRENKINAVVPETGVVVTVIRYPQAKAAEGYSYIADKRAMVLFGKRL
ncbi:MAG: beta-lactamase family protein [Xanthomonadales bacterium]|nr:beta-lactamase family protein [Xanthomonadales bacterium]